MFEWFRSLFAVTPASPEDVAQVLRRLDDLEDALASLVTRFGRLQKSRMNGGGDPDTAALLRELLARPGAKQDPFGEL